jgi:sigma-B regulation protein RsbU (phosphoserine phosphatase)
MNNPGYKPGEILEKANEAICMNNSEDMFVTVWLGILDIPSGVIHAANAGHEYPAVKHADSSFELLKDQHGFILGGMEDLSYVEYEIQMQPGTSLFLYTDGVLEATDKNFKLFGADRMMGALNSDPDAAPDTILENVQKAVDQFVGEAEQFDDITMMCLTYNGPEKKE